MVGGASRQRINRRENQEDAHEKERMRACLGQGDRKMQDRQT